MSALYVGKIDMAVDICFNNFQVQQIDGMKIFRFETSIYFANAEFFRDRLYDKTGLIPRKLRKKKRKAMHDTLIRRKRELEEAELQRKRERVGIYINCAISIRKRPSYICIFKAIYSVRKLSYTFFSISEQI